MIKRGASYFQKAESAFIGFKDNGNTFYFLVNMRKFKILKDDVLAGGTWSDNLTLDVRVYGGEELVSLPATLSTYTSSTVLEREMSRQNNRRKYLYKCNSKVHM